MRMFSMKTGLAASLIGVAVATLTLASSAQADTAPRSGDVVGVGSDTLQNAADFLFDGAPGVAGGYNNIGNNNRVANVFATGDANGRAVYDGTCGAKNTTTGLGTLCASTNDQTPELLPGSVILRAGTGPVVRPNGSGAGLADLTTDSSAAGYEGLPTGSIQYARASRLPNSTEEGNCNAITACGGLHVYQAATDQLAIAHDTATYNGPTGLSINELYHIFVLCDYPTWNAIPGNTSGSTDTIHPLVPQSGSGTLNFFMADIQAAEGLTSTPTPGPCTRTVEEHDPTGIYADSTPADAIEPFSVGKLTLINSGYFANGAGYSGTLGNAYTPNTLTTLSGQTPDHASAGVVYNSSRGLYFVIRNADLSVTTPFQTGGTLNWAKTLFSGSSSLLARGTAAPFFAAAGFTWSYKDCGNDPTTC